MLEFSVAATAMASPTVRCRRGSRDERPADGLQEWPMPSLRLGRLVLLIRLAVGLAGPPLPTAAAPLPAAVAQAAVPASQEPDDIVLQITSPRPGERLRGPVEITGYAFDPRRPTAEG